MDGQLLVPGADPAALLEPPDALLDDVPAAVRRLVERDGRVVAGPLVVLVRDDRLDAVGLQPVAVGPAAVPLVPGHLPRLPPPPGFAGGDERGDDPLPAGRPAHPPRRDPGPQPPAP